MITVHPGPRSQAPHDRPDSKTEESDQYGALVAAVPVEFTTQQAGTPPATSPVGVSCNTWPSAGLTLFDPSDTPAVASETFGARNALGVVFTSSAGGSVTAVRFYKAFLEAGTGHVGRW